MKKGLAILSVCLCFLSWTSIPGQKKRAFATYQEMRAYLGELFQQKKYAEAASLLEDAIDRFPDNVFANTFNLALARVYLGEVDKAVQALEEGHRRGIFYGIWDFENKLWDPVKKSPRFEAFAAANRARIEEAQKKASVKIEAVMPDGYDPAKTYPLFIALHGGGETIEDLKPAWRSSRLQSEFITVFVQSCQVASMKGYHWQDIAITRRDLRVAYKMILERHRVDSERAIIGGFSSGGFGSLIAVFEDLFPVRGFVVLCPDIPPTIRDEDILAAKTRGVCGTLLTTEMDPRVELQNALKARTDRLGLTMEFHLSPNTGHWFPKDFEALLDRAITLILPDK